MLLGVSGQGWYCDEAAVYHCDHGGREHVGTAVLWYVWPALGHGHHRHHGHSQWHNDVWHLHWGLAGGLTYTCSTLEWCICTLCGPDGVSERLGLLYICVMFCISSFSDCLQTSAMDEWIWCIWECPCFVLCIVASSCIPSVYITQAHRCHVCKSCVSKWYKEKKT